MFGAAAVGGCVLASGAFAADLSSESPSQIVQAAASAVASAKGYELQAVLYQSGKTETLTLINGANGNLDVRITKPGGESASILLVNNKAYIKASVAFWDAQHGVTEQQAAGLAPHWYKTSAKSFTSVANGLGEFAPSTLAKCIREGNGPLSHAGTTTVGGQQAIVLKKAGGQPGTGPGTVAIAASGKPYPLRIVETGPTKPGGKVDACNNGKGSNATGTVTLSHWNSPPAVDAPANPVTLPSN